MADLPPRGTIKSVTEAVGFLHSPEFDSFVKVDRPERRDIAEYKEPFGIWFRGQANSDWKLVPSIFPLSISR